MCVPGLYVAMCVGVVTFDTYVVDQVMHEKVWLAFLWLGFISVCSALRSWLAQVSKYVCIVLL